MAADSVNGAGAAGGQRGRGSNEPVEIEDSDAGHGNGGKRGGTVCEVVCRVVFY